MLCSPGLALSNVAKSVQMHPADQSIECPGCKHIFVRAGHLIAHYENARCREDPDDPANSPLVISPAQFQASVQQKHVVSEIMKDPERIREVLAGRQDELGSIAEGSETQDTEEGGVNILDQEDEGQKGRYSALEAEFDLISMHDTQSTRRALETWPRLPGQTSSKLSDSMARMSIGSLTPSISGTEMSASDFASEITSRRGGTKVYTESYPSLNSPSYSASTAGDDDAVSEATTRTVGSPGALPTASTTGHTSQALFKDTKPTPPAGEWEQILKHQEQKLLDQENERSNNLLYARWWDPSSADYDVARFLHPITGKYTCPFKDCDADYEVTQDVADHLKFAHMRTNFHCPVCLKRFKNASALISHSESTGKCQVKESKKYHQLLDQVSGGFLEAEHLLVPKIYSQEKAVVKKGEPVDGVMDTKFTAKFPNAK